MKKTKLVVMVLVLLAPFAVRRSIGAAPGEKPMVAS